MNKIVNACLILVLLLTGCRRNRSSEKYETVTFKADVPDAKPTFVRVDVSMSFDSLNQWLNRMPNRSLFKSGGSDSFIGFPIELAQQGSMKISAGQNQQLLVQLPTIFDAKPQIAGISAGNIHGKMQVKLAATLKLDDLTKANISNVGYTYEWIQKPSVSVAGFQINAAPIVDNLLASKADMIRQGLGRQLNELVNKKSLEGMMQTSVGPLLAVSKEFHLNVYGMHIENVQLNSKGISASCWIQSTANFHPMRESTTVFFPRLLNFHESDSKLALHGEIPWSFFEQILEKEFNRLSPSFPTRVRIQALDESKLTAKIVGFQGEKAEYSIVFVPIIFQDGALGIQVLQTKINGLMGVKRVFSKKIERRLLKYASKFRVDVRGQLAPWLNQTGSIQSINTSLRVNAYHWNAQNFYVLGEIGGHWAIMK